MDKICCRCREEKPLTEFVRNKCKSGGYAGYCKLCKRIIDNIYYKDHLARRKQIRSRDKKTREENRKIVKTYLNEHPCTKCGISDFRVLDFHHRNQSEKDYDIATMASLSTERLMIEIAKCDILCANCHRIKHAELRNNSPCSLIG